MLEGRLETVESVRAFMTAGNATLTLRSLKSGHRFTFKVKGSDDGHVAFVGLLRGSDNENDYTYLGLIRNGAYEHGRKSKVTSDAPSARAFFWFHSVVMSLAALPSMLEVWHEGKCGRCGRKLTTPESVARGIGPECATKL